MIPQHVTDWLAANGYRTDWPVCVTRGRRHMLATPGPQCVVLLDVVEDDGTLRVEPIRQVSLEVIARLNDLNPNFEVEWNGESRIEITPGTATKD